jgi:hypothetical protein
VLRSLSKVALNRIFAALTVVMVENHGFLIKVQFCEIIIFPQFGVFPRTMVYMPFYVIMVRCEFFVFPSSRVLIDNHYISCAISVLSCSFMSTYDFNDGIKSLAMAHRLNLGSTHVGSRGGNLCRGLLVSKQPAHLICLA